MSKQFNSPGFPEYVRNTNTWFSQGTDINAFSEQQKNKPSKMMAYLMIIFLIAFSNTLYAQGTGYYTCTQVPQILLTSPTQTACPNTTITININVNFSNPGGWTNLNITDETFRWRYIGSSEWHQVGRSFDVFYDGVTGFEIYGNVGGTAKCLFSNVDIDGYITSSYFQTPLSMPTVSVAAPSPVCIGGNATFMGTASNYDNLQWERSINYGATWEDIGGATALTYTVSNAPATANGYQYRLKAYKNGSPCTPTEVKSDAQSLSVSPAPAAPNASVTTQPSCTVTTGTITVTPVILFGTVFQYSIDGINYQTSNIFAGLVPKNYSVTVKNRAGCVSTALPLTVNPAPTGLNTPIASVTTQPSCTASTGTITVTPVTETDIQYSINGINYQTSNIFTGLTPGNYSVTVKNGGGCLSGAVPLTVNPIVPCAVTDLTPIITLPSTTFPVNGAKDFVVKLSEILGGTTAGTIAFNVVVPPGYRITMDNAATSVTVTGAGALTVSNPNWTATSVSNSEIDVIAKAGMTIAGNSSTQIGFHLERMAGTTSGTGNIVVAIYPDPTFAYDNNNANNLYARTITGTGN